MSAKKFAGYMALSMLAVLLLIHPPAGDYVQEDSEATKNVSLTGGPMVQIGNTDGLTSIVIAWRTREKSNSRVDYGESSAYGQRVFIHELTDHHAVVLRRLQPNRRYHYQVRSNDRVLAEAVFQTGKTGDTPFRFAVFGDSGSGSEAQSKLAQRLETYAADFIVHTGDVVYPKGADQDYRLRFYLPYKDILARIPIFPAIGNHDIETANGQPWRDNFVLPGDERFYSFSYGNAFFVALDSYHVNINTARWLEGQLSRTDKPWKFVFFHEPPWSNKTDRTGSAGARRLWVPVFEKYKVDLVFSGHDHLYTRYEPKDGVIYIVEGLGGNSRYEINREVENVEFTDNREFGFGLLTIAGPKLVFRHITASGTVLDTLTLTKKVAAAIPTS
jgi:hypothetical protein